MLYKLKVILIINTITSHTEKVTSTNQEKGMFFFILYLLIRIFICNRFN